MSTNELLDPDDFLPPYEPPESARTDSLRRAIAVARLFLERYPVNGWCWRVN